MKKILAFLGVLSLGAICLTGCQPQEESTTVTVIHQ